MTNVSCCDKHFNLFNMHSFNLYLIMHTVSNKVHFTVTLDSIRPPLCCWTSTLNFVHDTWQLTSLCCHHMAQNMTLCSILKPTLLQPTLISASLIFLAFPQTVSLFTNLPQHQVIIYIYQTILQQKRFPILPIYGIILIAVRNSFVTLVF